MVKLVKKNKKIYIDIKSVYDELGIKTKFSDWISRRIKRCNFKNNDFLVETNKNARKYLFDKDRLFKAIDLDAPKYDVSSIKKKITDLIKKETKNTINIIQKAKESIFDKYKTLFDQMLEEIDEKVSSYSTSSEMEIEKLKEAVITLTEENSKLKHELNLVKNITSDEVKASQVNNAHETIKLADKRITIESIWKNTQHIHNLKEEDFIKTIIGKGLIFRKKTKNGKKGSLVASSKCIKNGLMYMEENTFKTKNGQVGTRHQLVFTAAGEKFITDFIKKKYAVKQ